MIKSMYKPHKLTVNELVGNLYAFKNHHLFPRQNHIAAEKGKSIALKTIKGSGPNKKVSTTVLSDDDSNNDEEEMEILAKRFTRFFHKKKPYFHGFIRESSSTKGLKSIKNDEELENEDEEPNKGHLNKIKFFEYRKPIILLQMIFLNKNARTSML